MSKAVSTRTSNKRLQKALVSEDRRVSLVDAQARASAEAHAHSRSLYLAQVHAWKQARERALALAERKIRAQKIRATGTAKYGYKRMADMSPEAWRRKQKEQHDLYRWREQERNRIYAPSPPRRTRVASTMRRSSSLPEWVN